jgi:peptide deformylase
MAVKNIVVFPDARLRVETKSIWSLNEEVYSVASDLADTMFATRGLGIAAPQIGSDMKMFLVDVVNACPERQKEFPDPLVLINPEILNSSEETSVDREGCLSFPDVFVPIKRSVSIEMKATLIFFGNKTSEERIIKADGLFAKVLQHEYDHLTGKLMVDITNWIHKNRLKKKFK